MLINRFFSILNNFFLNEIVSAEITVIYDGYKATRVSGEWICVRHVKEKA